jgi:hypothetical protein
LSETFSLPNLKACGLDASKITTSEERLLIAMIFRAWADLSSPNRFIQNDAYYWVTDSLDEFAQWSFCWCCTSLGINAKQARKAILSNPFSGGWTAFVNNKKKLIDESTF